MFQNVSNKPKKNVCVLKRDTRENQQKDKDNFCPIYTSTIDIWAEDELSRDAMLLLLQLSTGIAEKYEWTLYYYQIESKIFYNTEVIEAAFKELVNKGYARIVGDRTYIRNDRRVEW